MYAMQYHHAIHPSHLQHCQTCFRCNTKLETNGNHPSALNSAATQQQNITVSRIHASNRWMYNTEVLLPLAGTFLNGERLGKHERKRLCYNDSVISLGLSPLRFKLVGEHFSKLYFACNKPVAYCLPMPADRTTCDLPY